MSTLQVRVATVEEVLPHPNADRLKVLTIGGYQTCTAEDYRPGDSVIYVPPDAVLPDALAEEWGVKSYLTPDNRVKTVKLRGFVSRGFVIRAEGAMVGADMAEALGITKYEPPEPVGGPDTMFEPQHPAFATYTEVERLLAYPQAFAEGEEVIVTEKIHGTNSRVAALLTDGGTRTRFACGTRRRQIKQGVGSKYELPLKMLAVRDLVDDFMGVFAFPEAVVLFGEIYGPQVQKRFDYGVIGSNGYAAFDLATVCRDEGEGPVFVPYDEFADWCRRYEVPMAPEVYRGPFSLERMAELADGPSLLGGTHIREGIVIRPVVERTDPELGRVILKRVGDTFEVEEYQWADSH